RALALRPVAAGPLAAFGSITARARRPIPSLTLRPVAPRPAFAIGTLRLRDQCRRHRCELAWRPDDLEPVGLGPLALRGQHREHGPGRPRRYCKRSCRQRDYEARRRAGELGINESELVVARHALDDLYDRLYVLEAAVEDVDRDLAAGDTAKEVRAALDWLLD